MAEINTVVDRPVARTRDGGWPWTNGLWGYGDVSRWLHWITAALMFALVALGLYSKTLADSHWRDVNVDFHKSLGLLVIIFTVLRLGWIAYYPSTSDDGAHRWEQAAARVGHTLLYVILLLMPLSGLLMSEGRGHDTSFFGLFAIPAVLPIDAGVAPREQHLYKLGKWLHDWPFQWALYAVFALHIVGVIKHRLIDGDRNFIRRIYGRPPALRLALLSHALFALASFQHRDEGGRCGRDGFGRMGRAPIVHETLHLVRCRAAADVEPEWRHIDIVCRHHPGHEKTITEIFRRIRLGFCSGPIAAELVPRAVSHRARGRSRLLGRCRNKRHDKEDGGQRQSQAEISFHLNNNQRVFAEDMM